MAGRSGDAVPGSVSSRSIVAIFSVSGRESGFSGYAYGADRTALVRYMHTLAVNLAPGRIRANAVSPGNTYFDGGIWRRIETGNPDLFVHDDNCR